MKKLFLSLLSFLLLFICAMSLFKLIGDEKALNRVFVYNGMSYIAPANQKEHLDLYKAVSSLQNYQANGFVWCTWDNVVQSFNDFKDSNVLNSGAVGSIMKVVNGTAGVWEWVSVGSGLGVISDLIIIPTMAIVPILTFIFYVLGSAFGYCQVFFDLLTGEYFFTTS